MEPFTNLPLDARIGCLGTGFGTFSYDAATAIYGPDTMRKHFFSCDTNQTVVESLRNGITAYAALAVHNSIGGIVEPALHALAQAIGQGSRLVVHSVTQCPITLCLIGFDGQSPHDITEVRSHHQVRGQCCDNLRRKCPDATFVISNNTDAAVAEVKALPPDKRPSTAAIASASAAEKYGGQILVQGLEDDPSNATRFLGLVRKQDLPPALAAQALELSPGFTVDQIWKYFQLAPFPTAIYAC